MEHAFDEAAAGRLVAKLRDFTADLDESERVLLATLLAPGVAAVLSAEEVIGFTVSTNASLALPRALAGALGRAQIRVVGLD